MFTLQYSSLLFQLQGHVIAAFDIQMKVCSFLLPSEERHFLSVELIMSHTAAVRRAIEKTHDHKPGASLKNKEGTEASAGLPHFISFTEPVVTWEVSVVDERLDQLLQNQQNQSNVTTVASVHRRRPEQESRSLCTRSSGE